MSDEKLTEKNAVIRSARISADDHGLLSAWLDLDYGGSGQGFGGYSLYLPKSYSHHESALQANYAGHFIWRVMEIAGVEHWHQLQGQTVRVRQSHSDVRSIGHVIKDDWFCPRDDFKEMQSRVTRMSPESPPE